MKTGEDVPSPQPPRVLSWTVAGALVVVLLGGIGVFLRVHAGAGDRPGRAVVAGPASAEERPAIDLSMPEAAPTSLHAGDTAAPEQAVAAHEAAPTEAHAPLPVDIRVLDEDGKPVVGAEVLVRSASLTPEDLESILAVLDAAEKKGGEAAKALIPERLRQSMAGAKPESTWETPTSRQLTGEDGTCRVELETSADEILARHDRLGTSGVWTPGRTSMDADGVKRIVEDSATLVLHRQATVRGVVRDPSGQRVANAEIKIGGLFMSSEGGSRTRSRQPPPTRSNGEGRFELTLDAPAWAYVKAVVGDKETADHHVDVEPGQALDIELSFAGAYAVRGVVLDGHGRPVEGATVEPYGWDSKGSNLQTTTQANGSFRLDLAAAGAYDLKASREGLVQSEPVHATVSDEAREAMANIELIESSTISGSVRWSTGEPASNAVISAHAVRRDLGEQYQRFGDVVDRRARVEADGHFVLEDIHPRFTYDLLAWGGPTVMVWSHGVAAGEKHLEIVLDREATKGVEIRVSVIDADSGAPVPRFELVSGHWINGVRSDSPALRVEAPDGRHVLTGLNPASEYGLIVAADGHGRRQVGPIRIPREGTDVTVVLGRNGGFRVTVVDAAGLRLPSAHVLLAEALSDTFDRYDGFRNAIADAQGVAEFRDEPPGRYVVLATTGKDRSDLLRADLGSGRTEDVRLAIAGEIAQGEVEVVARQSNGSPFVGAEIMITHLTDFKPPSLVEFEHDDDGGWSSSDPLPENPLSDAEGRQVISLRPGLYWVYVNTTANVFLPPKQAQIFAGQRATLVFDENEYN